MLGLACACGWGVPSITCHWGTASHLNHHISAASPVLPLKSSELSPPWSPTGSWEIIIQRGSRTSPLFPDFASGPRPGCSGQRFLVTRVSRRRWGTRWHSRRFAEQKQGKRRVGTGSWLPCPSPSLSHFPLPQGRAGTLGFSCCVGSRL